MSERKTLFTVTIKSGWGYWDVTQYPRGGCFRRLDADRSLRVDTECLGEVYGTLADNRRICIDKRALDMASLINGAVYQ